MSVTQLPFAPQANDVFTFSPSIAGTQYNGTATWNIFGARWYLNLTDLSGTLVLCRPLTSSGPQLQAAFTWVTPGTATAVCVSNHNVPVGYTVNFVASQTNSAFDGVQQGLATSATAITYQLGNPGISQALQGFINFNLNLVAGVIPDGWLLFRYESMTLEWAA